jgi:ankyrin repeat protein
MHWAAVNGHFDVVKMLQMCGDNGRTHRDRWGNSALDEAKRKKFVQIVTLLLDDIV